MDTESTTTSTASGVRSVREGKRIIWWNVIIGLFAAIALYRVTPPYQTFIVLFLLLRIIAIIFEYMLYLAFRAVSVFTSIPGIMYAWGAAFLATVAAYGYEVGESAFHYGMSVSPFYQVPPNIFQGIEGVSLLFLGYYFGKLPHGYGRLASWGRITHFIFGIALLLDGAVSLSATFSYLSPITVLLGVITFLLAVLLEYMILARTLALMKQGSALYKPETADAAPRKMFAHLADFGYVRNWKQAIGFYLTYLITSVAAVFLISHAMRLLLREVSPPAQSAFAIGALGASVISLFLAFMILRDKHLLKRFSSVIFLLAALITALFFGMAGALIIIAYLTTRRDRDSDHESEAKSDSSYQAPLPHAAPLPPNHAHEMHLAVGADMTEVKIPVTTHHEITKDALAPLMKKTAVKRPSAPKKAAATKTKKETKEKTNTKSRLKNKVAKAKEKPEEKAEEKTQDALEKKLTVTSEVVRDVA